MASDKDISFCVGVVLPAAGCGERMKLQTPKQFCEVNGRPLICHTIDCFHRLPWVQHIVISTSAVFMDLLKQLTVQYGFDKVTVVEGGTTRHRSIYAGVRALQQVGPGVEVVVIHDAVRPFVSPDVLRNIAAAAHVNGAAGVCRPLVSTVIARDAEQRLTESLDRSRYFNSEMPQAFQVPVIAKAYSQCTREDFDFGTECLLLAMKYGGVHAHILDGSADLWKVTYKKDLFAAEAMVKERLTRVRIVKKESWPELADSVTARLSASQFQVVDQSKPEAGSGDDTTLPTTNNTANTFVILHTHLTEHTCGFSPDHDADRPEPEVRGSRASREEGEEERNGVNGLTHSVGGQRLLETLKTMQSQCVSSATATGRWRLVDDTFVHVFVASSRSEGMKLLTELSTALLTLSAECQGGGAVVYGVLAGKETPMDKVSEMTTNVIQRGHCSFSGQLFLVL
ncbi:D-ribitol-5-phosphate cytidylyltransferase-like isoform X2 [Babylonia areolata]|uniref:D-ribitol-5-phosphate cytidylyltransferase-like isoform X2 n=1 Tax=Babylonia areolata TaxID=304850 RepID=UPI003FD1556E